MNRKKQETFLLTFATVAAGLLLFWLLLRYALLWLLPFLIAFALAELLEPCIRWCRTRLHFRRSFSAAALTLGLAIILILLVFYLFSRLFREALDFLEHLPELLAGLPGWVDQLQLKVDRFCAACPQELQQWVSSLTDSLAQESVDALGALSAGMLTELTGFASQLPQIMLFLVTTVLAVFFSLSCYPDIRAFLLRQFPERAQQFLKGIRSNIYDVLGRWLRAELVLILLTFVQLLAGLLLLQVDYALLLAFLTALVDALPILGAGTVLIPWALFNLLMDRIPLGIGLLALYAVITLVRSLMEPKLMAAQANLPPICSLLALYLGYCSAGFTGMLLFPILLLLVKRLHDTGYLHLWK